LPASPDGSPPVDGWVFSFDIAAAPLASFHPIHKIVIFRRFGNYRLWPRERHDSAISSPSEVRRGMLVPGAAALSGFITVPRPARHGFEGPSAIALLGAALLGFGLIQRQR
jgi:hypothetical protein